MIRSGFCRKAVVVTVLGLCLFVLNVRTASAPHSRYSTVSWEKVLTRTS